MAPPTGQFSEVDEHRTNFVSIIFSSEFLSVKMEPTVENLDIKIMQLDITIAKTNVVLDAGTREAIEAAFDPQLYHYRNSAHEN